MFFINSTIIGPSKGRVLLKHALSDLSIKIFFLFMTCTRPQIKRPDPSEQISLILVSF